MPLFEIAKIIRRSDLDCINLPPLHGRIVINKGDDLVFSLADQRVQQLAAGVTGTVNHHIFLWCRRYGMGYTTHREPGPGGSTKQKHCKYERNRTRNQVTKRQIGDHHRGTGNHDANHNCLDGTR